MSAHELFWSIAAGVALAVPYVLYALRVRSRDRVFAIGLVVAALIYVGFALFAGTAGDVVFELGGLALFAAIAFTGDRWSPRLLALGWMAHVAWDLLLHHDHVRAYAPSWYPEVCVGFDVLVAGAILAATTVRRDR